MKLRHHIHILEQENLGKISRIAELEIELYLLKVCTMLAQFVMARSQCVKV